MLAEIDNAINFGYPTLTLGDKLIKHLQDEGVIKTYKMRKYREKQRDDIQRAVHSVIKSSPWVTYDNPPKPTIMTTSDDTLAAWKDVTKND